MQRPPVAITVDPALLRFVADAGLRARLAPASAAETDGDPMARARRRLATALRSFQAERRATERGFDPWARCPFWRVPAPPVDRPAKAGAVAVLVDAIDSYLVWTVASASGWRSEEFSTVALEARVVLAPAGRVTLRAVTPGGREVEREVDVPSATLVAVRVEPRRWGWRWEAARWRMEAVGAVVVEVAGL